MSQDTLEQLHAKINALEARDMEGAIREAISHLPFANSSCRDATRDLIRAAVKREEDGSYSADGLALNAYISKQEWLGGMLAEVPAGNTANDGGTGRRVAADSFDLDAINSKMSPADRELARAAIRTELAKLSR